MKLPFLALFSFLLIIICADASFAQKRTAGRKPVSSTAAAKAPIVGQLAVVVDEKLAVLRPQPSLYAEVLQRIGRGRKVQILGSAKADGVSFYRVAAPSNVGWVQADAVFGKFRPDDEERLAKLVQALDGFDQVEAAVEFFMLYPTSRLRPALLLLYGDLLEDAAAKVTKGASTQLKRTMLAASSAPLHSYYLNLVGLDRYRKLGALFVFEGATRSLHYDGASWDEIVKKFPNSPQAGEAKKRLEALKTKMTGPSGS